MEDQRHSTERPAMEKLRGLGGVNGRFQDPLMGRAAAELGRFEPLIIIIGTSACYLVRSKAAVPFSAKPGRGLNVFCG